MDPNLKLSKSDAAYFALRRKITDFTLIPGQNISIKKLSDELKLSQTPLREALIGLEKDGYVIKNRNESFSVNHVDYKYLKDLFEYGMMLYKNFVLKFHMKDIYIDNIDVIPISDNDISIVDPDLFYRSAQIGTDNQFMSKQLEIFRCKSASMREAIKKYNKDLYSYIYRSPLITIDTQSNTYKILEIIHERKTESINSIANTVLLYATNNKCRRMTTTNSLQDVVSQ